MDLREEVEKYKCSFKRWSIQGVTTVTTAPAVLTELSDEQAPAQKPADRCNM